MCRHELRDLFDEDSPLAKSVVTPETSNSNRYRHGPTLPWKISKPAIIPAVGAV
jgi:hypothetical protein